MDLTDWKAGLNDLDDQGLGPSAANPLTAAGLDPDMVRANPELMASLRNGSPNGDVPSVVPPKPAAPPTPSTASAPAAAPAAPSAKAAGTVGGAGDAPTEDTPYSLAMSGLKNLDKTQGMANSAAEEVPTTDPKLAQMAAQREKLAAPVDLYDPTTGRMKAQAQVYNPETGQMDTINAKPSAGRRIWRGVRGGLVGLLEGGIPGAALGAIDPSLLGQEKYGAPTEALQRAEARNKEALGATDEGIKNEFTTWKDAVDAAKAKSTELRTNATIGKDQTTGGADLIKAQTDLQRAKNEDPATKDAAAQQLQAQEFQTRSARADSMKLSPLNRTLYILNGKLPDPREPNAAEIDAAAAARALVVFRQQHNGQGPQTVEDFNSIQAAARGTLTKGKEGGASDEQIAKIEKDKDTAIERANAEFAKNPYGDTARANYQRQLQTIQNGYEAAAAQFGVGGPHNEVTVDQHGQVTWTPQGAPAAGGAQAPATVAANKLPPPPNQSTAPQGAAGYVLNRRTQKYHWVDAAKKDLGEAK